jgi:hypothetical protein
VHTDPRIVANSMGYTGPLDKNTLEAAIGDLKTPYLLNPDVQIPDGHIWHSALVLPVEDGLLPDETWKNISRDYMQKMGIEDPSKYPSRWLSVRHGVNSGGQDHVHVVANLVRENGHRINTWKDYSRSQKAANFLEHEYGLRVLTSRERNTGGRGFSQADYIRSRMQGEPETRHQQLERRVRAAAAGATDQAEFVKNLTKDGIRFRPRKDHNGKDTGYSVNLPGTTTQGGTEHWWAGGKLARDLSLPRLQQRWTTPTYAPPVPSHVSALAELQDLTKQIPTANGEQLADIAHQLAGALASASLKTETVPGPLAQGAKDASALAQTKTYTWKPKPPSLGIGMLFLQAQDPTGPVGQAVMIRQLLAAAKALSELHLARKSVAATARRSPSMTQAPDDELLTTAVTAGATGVAMLLEHRAHRKAANLQPSPPPQTQKDRNRELWDRNTILRDRRLAQAEQGRKNFVPPPDAQTSEQRAKLSALAEEFELPVLDINSSTLNKAEADDLINALEASRVPGWEPTPEPSLPDIHIASTTHIGTVQTPEQAKAFESWLERQHEARNNENPFEGQTAAAVHLTPDKNFGQTYGPAGRNFGGGRT